MANLMFALFLLAFLQHVLSLKPYGGSPPYPLPYGNSNNTVQPTATGHHRPLVSTTGAPYLHNDTMIDTPLQAASYSPDCIYAAKWSPYTFVQCLSDSEAVRGKVQYTISASGTGQEPSSWANAIFDNVKKGPCSVSRTAPWQDSNGPFIDSTNNATYNYVIDGWSRRIMQLHGFTMSFFYTSWDSNNCHDVVRDAIAIATCPGVSVANGLACRKKGYYGDNSLPSGSPTYNHPEIGDYDDNDAGPP